VQIYKFVKGNQRSRGGTEIIRKKQSKIIKYSCRTSYKVMNYSSASWDLVIDTMHPVGAYLIVKVKYSALLSAV
jgi:hypothetical protein